MQTALCPETEAFDDDTDHNVIRVQLGEPMTWPPVGGVVPTPKRTCKVKKCRPHKALRARPLPETDAKQLPCRLQISKQQWQPQLHFASQRRPCNTSRQWEKRLAKELTLPQRAELNVIPYQGVTRYMRGSIIVEIFLDLDLDELADRPCHPKSAQEQEAYTNRLLGSVEQDYIAIPAGYTYIAMDKNQKRLVAVFPKGPRDVYGSLADDVLTTVRANIEELLKATDPTATANGRHSLADKWKEANPHLTKVGTLAFGEWSIQGNPNKGPRLTADVVKNAGLIPPMQNLLQSFGNVTRAIDLLFGAVDVSSRDAYRQAASAVPPEARKMYQTLDHELFLLRILLVNLWTQPHRDRNDWHSGWAFLLALGDFSGGDFCITELKRRIPFPTGAILGLRGGALEHWTTKWDGRCRYSLVHTTHEYVRQWYGMSAST